MDNRKVDRHKLYPSPCPECGKVRHNRKARAARLCRQCGSKFSKLHGMTGSSNPNWKGGRLASNGYILRISKGHPKADGKGYVREHVLVMEEMLGRRLASHENVHHKNGIRHDNATENLELWARPQPAGQRIQDLLSWVVSNYPHETRTLLDARSGP